MKRVFLKLIALRNQFAKRVNEYVAERVRKELCAEEVTWCGEFYVTEFTECTEEYYGRHLYTPVGYIMSCTEGMKVLANSFLHKKLFK